MSATNHTANIELPIFVGDDKPAWLTDWNGAMTTIDGAVGTAQTDISGISATVSTQGGQISSLTTTVGNHTTSISALTDATTHNAGDINTINSLIGNGTPTTTDHTIIGAINELHTDQGDLDDLTTTDKSSLVAAINEVASATPEPGSVPTIFSQSEVSLASVTADGVKTFETLLNELASAFVTAMGSGGSLRGKNVLVTRLYSTNPTTINLIGFYGKFKNASGAIINLSGFTCDASDYYETKIRLASNNSSHAWLVQKAGSYLQDAEVPAAGCVYDLRGFVD